MLAKRSILFVGFVVVVLLLLVVSITQCQQQNGSPYHDFLSSETFQKLSRAQQLDKCATCHQQIFDNEKRGPHAFSFQSITQHKAFVNSKQYDCDFYTQHVNRSFEHCLGCHTPQNLYQTVLNPAQYKSGTMVDSLLHIEHPRPLTRERAGGQLTGIDCMSCHFDGQQMVSLKHIPTKDDSIASKQTVQQLTKNNLNCYLCHFDAVRNFNPDIAIKKTGTAMCVNCHIETNPKGAKTHYFYWQHDAEGKSNPKPSLVMDDFHFSLSIAKKEGVITWLNTIMPHKISPGPEMILYCDVLSNDSVVLGSKTIRINKKEAFDKEMYATLGRNQLGVTGDDVPLDGTAIEYRFPVQQADKAAIFRIQYVHKSQYWFPDSLGTKGIVKYYPCR